MTKYTAGTSALPYPEGKDKVAVQADIQALATQTDLAISAEGSRVVEVAAAQSKTEVNKALARVALVEEISSEPGSRLENMVIDPKPAFTVGTWEVSGATLQQANEVWGRAIATGGVVASIRSLGSLRLGVDSKALLSAGQGVAGRVTIRAMETQRMSATLSIVGYAWDGSAFTERTVIATSGQLHINPGAANAITFEAVGSTSANTPLTHFHLEISFRRYGETYPTAGDHVYFRQAALYSGPNAKSPVPYVDGDNADAFWVDGANKSTSVRLTRRYMDTSGASEDAFRRDAIVGAGIGRRGGKIGTNGVAAVALRFDHHLPNFKTKILPLLKQYRLPWGQMLNSARVADGTEGMTYAQIAAECYSSGGEVWNHGYSHADMPDKATADREVAQGFKDLTAGLPGLCIDGWAGPGQANMMGMEGSDTPEKFWGTYPGRLVMARHAFVRGYYPGVYQPLTGSTLTGSPHVTMDTLDDTYVSGIVRGAVSAKSGVTLMLHPNYLDTTGYMTTAQLGKILADLAARRDAGELLVLSPTAILLADSSSDYRRDLLTTGGAGSKTATWSETVSSRASQTQYGVPHELVVTVRAKVAGTVVLNLKETGTPRFDTSHSVTLAAGAVATLRCLATLPLDCAGILAQLTGNIDHSDIQLHAV